MPALRGAKMRGIVLLLVVVLLAACKPAYIRTEQVNKIAVGSSSQHVESVLEREPNSVTSVAAGGADYTVHIYRMLTDMEEHMTMICDQYGCYPIWYTEPVTEPYVVVFRDEKAVFWGFIEELNKHNDPALNQAGRAAIKLINSKK
jgi:hypothetical protein